MNYDNKGELVQQKSLWPRAICCGSAGRCAVGVYHVRNLALRHSCDLHYISMVTITFPDRETEKRALAFLLGRFSGRILRSGEHIVPEAALEALADQDIPFTVKGKTTYEQQMAAIRGPAPTSVQ